MGQTFAVIVEIWAPPANVTERLRDAVLHLCDETGTLYAFPRLHAGLRGPYCNDPSRNPQRVWLATGSWYKAPDNARGHVSRVLGRRGLRGRISIVVQGEEPRFSSFQPPFKALP